MITHGCGECFRRVDHCIYIQLPAQAPGGFVEVCSLRDRTPNLVVPGNVLVYERI
jgi:hypothetical protein